MTDAFIITQFADVCLLITCYKYTNKKLLKLVLKDLKQKNIENETLMLNDNRIDNE